MRQATGDARATRAMWMRTALMASCLAMLAACASGPQVRANYDRSADFSRYRSFGFFEKLGTDEAGYSSLITQQLKASTRRELETRGYTYAETGADLLVNFNASLANQTRVTQTPTPGPYYGYRYGYYGGWTGYQTRVDQYVEGTLNIDIVDAARKQLVWEGVAVGRVSEKAERDRAAAIDGAVREIFTEYPFRAGSATQGSTP